MERSSEAGAESLNFDTNLSSYSFTAVHHAVNHAVNHAINHKHLGTQRKRYFQGDGGDRQLTVCMDTTRVRRASGGKLQVITLLIMLDNALRLKLANDFDREESLRQGVPQPLSGPHRDDRRVRYARLEKTTYRWRCSHCSAVMETFRAP